MPGVPGHPSGNQRPFRTTRLGIGHPNVAGVGVVGLVKNMATAVVLGFRIALPGRELPTNSAISSLTAGISRGRLNTATWHMARLAEEASTASVADLSDRRLRADRHRTESPRC